MTHALQINSLTPGNAHCSCGEWAFLSSFNAAPDYIRREHNIHRDCVEDVAAFMCLDCDLPNDRCICQKRTSL